MGAEKIFFLFVSEVFLESGGWQSFQEAYAHYWTFTVKTKKSTSVLAVKEVKISVLLRVRNMDSNERNNSVSVPGSIAKDTKTEPVGECKNSVVVKVNTDTGSNSIVEDKLKNIQKRKIAERFEVNMDNEDSDDSVKRMRYSKGKNEALTNNKEGAKEAYTLLLTNSPGEWTSQEVLDFVKDEVSFLGTSLGLLYRF